MRIIREKEFEEIKNKMTYTGCKGNTGHIYKLDNLAIKLFKKPFRATREVIQSYEILSSLQTKRFVMLKDVICRNNKVIGLTTDYIDDDKGPLDNMNMELLSKELKIIKDDMKILNENKIALMDCYEGNVMFSNGIYIIDTQEYQPLSIYPGLFKTLIQPGSSYTLENFNLYQMNSTILYFLSNRLSDEFENDNEEFILLLQDELKKQGGGFNTYVGDIMDKDRGDLKTFKQYVYKKINN